MLSKRSRSCLAAALCHLFQKNSYTISKSYGVILTISVVSATPFAAQLIERFHTKKTAKQLLNILEPAVLIVLMLTVTAYLIQDSYNPFLYFRF